MSGYKHGFECVKGRTKHIGASVCVVRIWDTAAFEQNCQ